MTKPNIIFIFSDQQNYNTMGCTGNDVINTPDLDRLAGAEMLAYRVVDLLCGIGSLLRHLGRHSLPPLIYTGIHLALGRAHKYYKNARIDGGICGKDTGRDDPIFFHLIIIKQDKSLFSPYEKYTGDYHFLKLRSNVFICTWRSNRKGRNAPEDIT